MQCFASPCKASVSKSPVAPSTSSRCWSTWPCTMFLLRLHNCLYLLKKTHHDSFKSELWMILYRCDKAGHRHEKTSPFGSLMHVQVNWMCGCPHCSHSHLLKNKHLSCDSGSWMRSLTGSGTWGWFMCQHMHVMSLELPPQHSTSVWSQHVFTALLCLPGSRSEPAKGSPKGAQICGPNTFPAYMNIKGSSTQP